MRTEAPYQKSLMKQGIVIGLQASLIASALLWLVIILVGLFFRNNTTSGEQTGSYGYGVIVIFVLATVFISLIPGSVGGALNSYILSRLAFKKKLTTATSVWFGFLTGFGVGFTTGLTVYLLPGDIVYHLADAVWFALLIACVAAPVGAWHGWRVGKWLMKNE